MNSINWYPSQAILFKAKEDDDTIVISRDIPPGDGPKSFTWFKTFESLNNFLEATKQFNPHLYELILDTDNYPTFMYFDIDRDITQERDIDLLSDIDMARDVLINTFMTKLTQFLKKYHDLDIILENGKNTQISYTNTNTKLSAHIKIDIKFKNAKEHKIFATNLDRYIRSNLYTTDDEREILMFYKSNKDGLDKERNQQTVVDLSGYGKFKSFRLLYSSKLKKVPNTGKPLYQRPSYSSISR